MNAKQLKEYLEDLETQGFDLNQIPLVYIELEEDRKTKKYRQIGYLCDKDYVNLVSPQKCIELEDPMMHINPDIPFALLIGRVNIVD